MANLDDDNENDNNNADSVPDHNVVANIMEAEMDNENVLNNMDMDNL